MDYIVDRVELNLNQRFPFGEKPKLGRGARCRRFGEGPQTAWVFRINVDEQRLEHALDGEEEHALAAAVGSNEERRSTSSMLTVDLVKEHVFFTVIWSIPQQALMSASFSTATSNSESLCLRWAAVGGDRGCRTLRVGERLAPIRGELSFCWGILSSFFSSTSLRCFFS